MLLLLNRNINNYCWFCAAEWRHGLAVEFFRFLWLIMRTFFNRHSFVELAVSEAYKSYLRFVKDINIERSQIP